MSLSFEHENPPRRMPGAPDIFFAGSTNTLTRYDRRTGVSRDVQPHPRIVMGEPASAMPEMERWVRHAQQTLAALQSGSTDVPSEPQA